jgi:hypothetical protein
MRSLSHSDYQAAIRTNVSEFNGADSVGIAAGRVQLWSAATAQIRRDESLRFVLNYLLTKSTEAGVKLPKIDWRHELTLNLALLGSVITLVGLMALVLRSIGKW